jgi:hypothetical protein
MGTERFLCEPTFVYDSRDTTFEGRQGLRVHRLATGMEAVQRSSRAHAGATCIKTACRGNVHQDRMPGATRIETACPVQSAVRGIWAQLHFDHTAASRLAGVCCRSLGNLLLPTDWLERLHSCMMRLHSCVGRPPSCMRLHSYSCIRITPPSIYSPRLGFLTAVMLYHHDPFNV